jgi:hypothetical protein
MSTNWRGRYEHCFRIMEDFQSRHPGVISADVAREAWAHSFVQRARARCFIAGEHRAAIVDVARALRYKPAYVQAWKSLARICLTAAGLPARESALRT